MAEALQKLCCPSCLAEVWLTPRSIERNHSMACPSCHENFEARQALPPEPDAGPSSRLDEAPQRFESPEKVQPDGNTTLDLAGRRLRLHQVSQSAWEKLTTYFEAWGPRLPVDSHSPAILFAWTYWFAARWSPADYE